MKNLNIHHTVMTSTQSPNGKERPGVQSTFSNFPHQPDRHLTSLFKIKHFPPIGLLRQKHRSSSGVSVTKPLLPLGIIFGMLAFPQVFFSIPAWAQKDRPVLIHEWVRLLDSNSPEDRIRAAQKLGELRAIDAVDDLGRHRADPEPKVRYHVIRALLDIRDPSIEPYLGKALNDRDPTNRTEALRSVYAYYLGTTVSSGLHKVKNLMLFRHFRPQNPPWKKVHSEVVRNLRSWLLSTDESMQIRAIQAVEYLWIYDLTDDIVQLLKQPTSEAIIYAAFRTLGTLKACPQLEQLIDWIRHENDQIMEHAVWGVAQCGSVSRRIQQQLYQAYTAESRASRQHVYYRGLAQAGVPEAKPLFLQGLTSDDKNIRRWAAEGLGRIHARDRIYDLAVAFLRENDRSARLAMAFALFLLGRKEHIINFLKAFDDGNDLRNQAASYTIEYPDAIVPELFRFFPQLDHKLQERILTIVGRTDSPAVLPHLEKLMNEKDETIAVRAFEALKQVRQAIALRPQRPMPQ